MISPMGSLRPRGLSSNRNDCHKSARSPLIQKHFSGFTCEAMSDFRRPGAMQKLANTAFSRSETLSRNNRRELVVCDDSLPLSRSSSAPQKVESSQLYIPGNYVKPEILAMVRSWKRLQIKVAMEQQGVSDTESPPKTRIDEMYDPPPRTVEKFDPPTRFPRRCGRYRTRRPLLHNRDESDPTR